MLHEIAFGAETVHLGETSEEVLARKKLIRPLLAEIVRERAQFDRVTNDFQPCNRFDFNFSVPMNRNKMLVWIRENKIAGTTLQKHLQKWARVNEISSMGCDYFSNNYERLNKDPESVQPQYRKGLMRYGLDRLALWESCDSVGLLQPEEKRDKFGFIYGHNSYGSHQFFEKTAILLFIFRDPFDMLRSYIQYHGSEVEQSTIDKYVNICFLAGQACGYDKSLCDQCDELTYEVAVGNFARHEVIYGDFVAEPDDTLQILSFSLNFEAFLEVNTTEKTMPKGIEYTRSILNDEQKSSIMQNERFKTGYRFFEFLKNESAKQKACSHQHSRAS